MPRAYAANTRGQKQRQVLAEAKLLAGKASLIPADRTYVQQLKRYEDQCVGGSW